MEKDDLQGYCWSCTLTQAAFRHFHISNQEDLSTGREADQQTELHPECDKEGPGALFQQGNKC